MVNVCSLLYMLVIMARDYSIFCFLHPVWSVHFRYELLMGLQKGDMAVILLCDLRFFSVAGARHRSGVARDSIKNEHRIGNIFTFFFNGDAG